LVLVADDALRPQNHAQRVLELLKSSNIVSEGSQENSLGSRSQP
jgi:hypothetical protein